MVKNIWRSGYLTVACFAALPLFGCGDPDIFDRVAPPSDPSIAQADWPRLADTHPVPPRGIYTDAAPDPAVGIAAKVELGAEADEAERRRQAVSGPVR